MIIMKKAFNLGYKIVSTLVIVFGIMLALIYICGIRLYHVKTGSMAEQIPEGSLCFVSTYSKYESIKSGDVIAFKASEDMLVTHRAVEITEEGIITKGDANNTNDADPVTKEKYIGKTVYSVPKLGAALAKLKSTKGLICGAVLIILLLVAGQLYKRTAASGEDEK